jgi:hypothetical protein
MAGTIKHTLHGKKSKKTQLNFYAILEKGLLVNTEMKQQN